MPSPTPPSVGSFEMLVREHQAGLRAYVRALGTQDAWVDDLAQEVFLVAYRRMEAFEAGADFGRWLRGIARHLVLNELRKNARRSRLLQDAITEVLADEPDDASATAATPADVMRALSDCVAELPVRHRELLQRRYAESADAPTLARAFNISAISVRQTLVRTRAAVRRCIGTKLGAAWQ